MLARLRQTTPVNSAAPDSFTIPEPVEVSAELRDLLDRRQQFADRIPVLELELSNAVKVGLKNRRKLRVADLLAGKPKITDQYRDPGEIDDELGDVREAINQLDDQISDARSKVSAIIRGMVAPEHRRLVGEIARTMVAVRDAWAQYLTFADGLNSRQISWSALRPMHPNFLGDPRDNQSAMAFWFREAAEYGLIDLADLPKDIQIWLWCEAR